MLIRTAQPKLIFNSEIKTLEYDTNVLLNNIPLYSIEDKNQSVCGIEIVFSGGKVEEVIKGASYFSTNLLKSGTNNFNSTQISAFFELRGAFVQMQNGLDYNSISLYCLTTKLSEVLPFFMELFTESVFPQKQLTKLVKKKEQELKINQQKSNYWATKLLKEALFGSHPYGHILDEKDISSITSADLTEHWKNFSLNRIQFITSTGNFNLDKVITQLEILSDTITPGMEGYKNKAQINSKYLFKRKKIPNNEQSSLKIGIPSISLKSKDYPILSLGNTIWGGYFGSRLMQSIREDKGLTYGINSSLINLLGSSYVQISADLKKNAGDEVIELIAQELKSLTNEPIKEQELIKVKNYLIGEYRSNSETIFDRISKVKFLKLHNLEDHYYSKHFNTLLNANPAQIQKVLKETIVPQSFNIALVE